MAEAAPQPWKDLPGDLLTEIARLLPCLVDRLCMSRTCHDWWFVVQRPRPPRQLPWLLLPEPTTVPLPDLVPARSGSTRTVSFYCVLGHGDTHNLRIGHDTGGARFFGSYDGGWLLLAHRQFYHHALLNLHTDRRLFLPDYAYCVAPGGRDVRIQVTITMLACTFSSQPGRNVRCFGGAIVAMPWRDGGYPRVAFWSMDGAGDRRPVALGFVGSPCSRLEDIIHHKGAFHSLTSAEHVDVYDMFNLHEGEECTQWGVRVHHERYDSQAEAHSSSVRVGARYLVESRGELLMVVRFAGVSPRRHQAPLTGAFLVYRATQRVTGAGLVRLAWTQLPSLDGRMLFVARGCSRAYEVTDFPGFGGAGDTGVYFLDDWRSGDVDVVSQRGKFQQPFTTVWKNGRCELVEDETSRRYTCSDNGRCQWVEGESRLRFFRRWFTDKERSNYSSPVWFIP